MLDIGQCILDIGQGILDIGQGILNIGQSLITDIGQGRQKPKKIKSINPLLRGVSGLWSLISTLNLVLSAFFFILTLLASFLLAFRRKS